MLKLFLNLFDAVLTLLIAKKSLIMQLLLQIVNYVIPDLCTLVNITVYRSWKTNYNYQTQDRKTILNQCYIIMFPIKQNFILIQNGHQKSILPKLEVTFVLCIQFLKLSIMSNLLVAGLCSSFFALCHTWQRSHSQNP